MLNLEYLKIFIFLVVALGFISLLVFLSFLLNKDLGLINKKKPVECGSQLLGSGKNQIEINFFIVAIVFVVFEIELLVVLPWALFFYHTTVFSFVSMMLFLFILVLGLIIEYLNDIFNF